MELRRFLCLLFLVCLTSFLSATEGYKFYVGGTDGWVLKPSETYNQWAERNRFRVNDTLNGDRENPPICTGEENLAPQNLIPGSVPGSDSVLVVNKNNYFNCNTSNPIQKLDEGNSEFKFDRSGPFYFISGQEGNCPKGQKLIIIVLAVRHPKTPAQPPLAAPPQGSSPAATPKGSAPSGQSPSSSPSHAPSTNPTTSPVPAPATSTTPTSSPPSMAGLAPTPSGGAAEETSPPPGTNENSTSQKNGGYGVTASSVVVSSVIVLVSLALTSSFY